MSGSNAVAKRSASSPIEVVILLLVVKVGHFVSEFDCLFVP